MSLRHFIPQLISELTRKPRYIPEVEWSKDSWTHNVFRFFELVFGRSYGPNGVGDTIRLESSACIDEYGNRFHVCHSWESVFAYAETFLRTLVPFKKLKPFRLFIPMLQTPQGVTFASPYLFAIAFDAATDGGYSGGGEQSPYSWSHTCTGSNLALIVYHGINVDTDQTTGVTYNSVSMAAVDKLDLLTAGYHYSWVLVAPSTGANTVTITGTGANGMYGTSQSYSGCAQTGQPDAHTIATAVSASTDSVALASVADNCWHTAFFRNGAGNQPTAGANTTSRAIIAATGAWMACDSNSAKTPAGSVTLNATAGAGIWIHGAMTLAPTAGTPAIIFTPTLSMLRVG